MVTQELNCNSIQRFFLRSTDPAPSGAGNGSTIIEVDTGKMYAYDAANDIWYVVKRSSSSSGGGGSGTRSYIYIGTDNKYYVGTDGKIYVSNQKEVE